MLVVYGDVPLIDDRDPRGELVATHAERRRRQRTDGVRLDDPTGLGRILRDDEGNFTAIREEK